MDCVRCKDPIDTDSNFCKKCGMQQDAEIRPMEEMPTLPSKESTGQKALGYGIAAVIVIGLGILTGVLLRAGSP